MSHKTLDEKRVDAIFEICGDAIQSLRNESFWYERTNLTPNEYVLHLPGEKIASIHCYIRETDERIVYVVNLCYVMQYWREYTPMDFENVKMHESEANALAESVKSFVVYQVRNNENTLDIPQEIKSMWSRDLPPRADDQTAFMLMSKERLDAKREDSMFEICSGAIQDAVDELKVSSVPFWYSRVNGTKNYYELHFSDNKKASIQCYIHETAERTVYVVDMSSAMQYTREYIQDDFQGDRLRNPEDKSLAEIIKSFVLYQARCAQTSKWYDMIPAENSSWSRELRSAKTHTEADASTYELFRRLEQIEL